MSTAAAATLASDRRAGTFARRKARTLQRDYLRRSWRKLLPLYLGMVACCAWPALFRGPDFLRGLIVGLAVAGCAGAMVTLVIIQTGTGPVMAGELAEQWTAQELAVLLEHDYRLVNHVIVDGRGDADHVLVGPGGLFLLETKWSSNPWTGTEPWQRAQLEQLRGRTDRTRLRLKRHGVPSATAVLVLWGPAARVLADGTGVARADGVYVIAGVALRRWLLARAPGQLPASTVEAVHEQLCRWAAQTDAREDPVPASVEQLVSRAVRAAVLCTVAFLLPWLALPRLGPLALLLAPALLAAGLLARRRGLAWGTGVAIGAGAASALAGGTLLLDLTTQL